MFIELGMRAPTFTCLRDHRLHVEALLICNPFYHILLFYSRAYWTVQRLPIQFPRTIRNTASGFARCILLCVCCWSSVICAPLHNRRHCVGERWSMYEHWERSHTVHTQACAPPCIHPRCNQDYARHIGFGVELETATPWNSGHAGKNLSTLAFAIWNERGGMPVIECRPYSFHFFNSRAYVGTGKTRKLLCTINLWEPFHS